MTFRSKPPATSLAALAAAMRSAFSDGRTGGSTPMTTRSTPGKHDPMPPNRSSTPWH